MEKKKIDYNYLKKIFVTMEENSGDCIRIYDLAERVTGKKCPDKRFIGHMKFLCNKECFCFDIPTRKPYRILPVGMVQKDVKNDKICMTEKGYELLRKLQSKSKS